MAKRLNHRQQTFITLYASGPDGIKGNATACYLRVGYKVKDEEVARINASRLLTNANVIVAIQRLYAQADAAAIARLRDWKAMAPNAQRCVDTLSRGYLPDPEAPEGTSARPIVTRDDAAVARVLLEANKFIIERAYPKKLMVDVTDPRAELAAMLGVLPDELP